MGRKFKFPKWKKQEPEVAAEKFCSEIRKIIYWLEYQTYDPDKIRNARTQVHSLRDEYHRNRGSGYCSQLVQLADCGDRKVSAIVNLNPEDWNNYRRGQRFRYLNSSLLDFEIARFRSRHAVRQS